MAMRLRFAFPVGVIAIRVAVTVLKLDHPWKLVRLAMAQVRSESLKDFSRCSRLALDAVDRANIFLNHVANVMDLGNREAGIYWYGNILKGISPKVCK